MNLTLTLHLISFSQFFKKSTTNQSLDSINRNQQSVKIKAVTLLFPIFYFFLLLLNFEKNVHTKRFSLCQGKLCRRSKMLCSHLVCFIKTSSQEFTGCEFFIKRRNVFVNSSTWKSTKMPFKEFHCFLLEFIRIQTELFDQSQLRASQQ